MVMNNKKAAFEMSVSTMIIIVLAIVFLILGLTLVRNIFGNATESVDDVNEQMKSQIRNIFSDGSEKLFILLGNDKIANVRADASLFSFWVGARTNYGSSVTNRSDMQYILELDPASDCYQKLKATQISKWFVNPTMPSTGKTGYNDVRDIGTTAQDSASARIQLKIPEGTPLCQQEVFVTFYDNTQDPIHQTIAGSSFTINVLRKSLF